MTLLLGKRKWIPAVAAAWMALTLLPSTLFLYHFSALAMIFFPLALSCAALLKSKAQSSRPKAQWLFVLAILCVTSDYAINRTSLDSSIVWNNDKNKEHVYYATVNVLSQFDHPTISYFPVEQGVETEVDALPASKYWCIPVHKQLEGSADLVQAILQHQVDVVMMHVFPHDDDHGVTSALTECGYHKCFTLDYYEKPWTVWTVREVATPQLDYEASWQDVLLKRRPRFLRD